MVARGADVGGARRGHTAVHNAGGLVIVQVERVSDSGKVSSPARVKIPASIGRLRCRFRSPSIIGRPSALATRPRSVESCGGFAARSRRWS